MFMIDQFKKLTSQIKSKRQYQDYFSMKTIDPNVEACYKMGYGPKKFEYQESYCQVKNLDRNIHFFAIYDGHGKYGKQASQAANDHTQTFLEKYIRNLKNKNDDEEVKQFLIKAYQSTESMLKNSRIDYSSSGTCVVGILIINDKCYSFNLGDSRAVLYKESASRKIAFELTYDHRPTRIDEKERILQHNGKISKILEGIQPIGPDRIWENQKGPGITTTRAYSFQYLYLDWEILMEKKSDQFLFLKQININ